MTQIKETVLWHWVTVNFGSSSRGFATRVFFLGDERLNHSYVETAVRRDYMEEEAHYEDQYKALRSGDVVVFPSEEFPKDEFHVYARILNSRTFCCVLSTKARIARHIVPKRPFVEVPSSQIVEDSREETLREGIRTWADRTHNYTQKFRIELP